MSGIRDGGVLDDCDFKLLASGKEGEVKSLHFLDAYLIVDNGNGFELVMHGTSTIQNVG
jgi:hypothetical protein